MQIGKQGEINVTPLIDVLLVLLIIFMVIIPHREVGLNASVPQPAESNQPPPPPRDIVVSVHADRTIDINTEKVTWEKLPDRLKEILARRPDGIFYIAGAPSLDFMDIARVLDDARGAGIHSVGIMPRR